MVPSAIPTKFGKSYLDIIRKAISFRSTSSVQVILHDFRFNIAISARQRKLKTLPKPILKNFAILNLKLHVITWPDEVEQNEIAFRMKSKYDFPNLVGIADGTILPLAYHPVTNLMHCLHLNCLLHLSTPSQLELGPEPPDCEE